MFSLYFTSIKLIEVIEKKTGSLKQQRKVLVEGVPFTQMYALVSTKKSVAKDWIEV